MKRKTQDRPAPGPDRESLLGTLMALGRGRSAQPPIPEAPPPVAQPYVVPSRRTKKTFTVWLDKDALVQLKRLSEHQADIAAAIGRRGFQSAVRKPWLAADCDVMSWERALSCAR
jgi:hypothetical protein